MDAPANVGTTTNQTIIQHMRKQAPFEIGYGALALAGMAKVERKHRSSVRQAIEEQLSHQPLVETRNRKALIKLARHGEETWELRCGPSNRFRVFYQVDLDNRRVLVVAVAVKVGNRLYVGGEEFVP